MAEIERPLLPLLRRSSDELGQLRRRLAMWLLRDDQWEMGSVVVCSEVEGEVSFYRLDERPVRHG
jgi:hypothetical protein